MTRFKPGNLAIVTGDTAGWEHRFERGHAVAIVRAHEADYLDDVGYDCRSTSTGRVWTVAESDLHPLVPGGLVVAPTPTPSPLAALIEAATAFLCAVLANRVSIEQEWQDPRHTTYRIVVTPKEKS